MFAEQVQAGNAIVPPSFSNIYETNKINDPARRINMARTQAILSGGRVFRGRRKIFTETLESYLAKRFSLTRQTPPEYWFLSDLCFEAVADYSPEIYGFAISQRVMDFIRANPEEAMFNFLAFNADERTRVAAVQQYSRSSADLVRGIESRRQLIVGETFALRKRAYGARLIIDEIDFILETGRRLGLHWESVSDLSSSLVRSLISEIPILNVERELAVRLEDQTRSIEENDLRDMAAFTSVLPPAR